LQDLHDILQLINLVSLPFQSSFKILSELLCLVYLADEVGVEVVQLLELLFVFIDLVDFLLDYSFAIS
jgi:hypothetical protein